MASVGSRTRRQTDSGTPARPDPTLNGSMPHDQQAEQALIGALLTQPNLVVDLDPADLYNPIHATIHRTIHNLTEADQPADLVTVTAALLQAGELQRIGGAPYLHDCMQACPSPAHAGHYANIITEHARQRRTIEIATRLTQIAHIDDPERRRALTTQTIEQLTHLTQPPPDQPSRTAVELDALLAEDEPEHDWLIPGLIERGDRMLLTGPEGQGKSTFLRQFGTQAASGIHPFDGDNFPPLKVLFVELENGRRHTRRAFRALRLAAGKRYKPEPGMHIECRPEGIDLLNPDQGQWLLDLTAFHKADLLITGPLYKLAGGDPTEERTARTVALWLDRIRSETGCALILEAHTPHAANGKRRPERPYGASLWLRWPEFGLYLSPEGHLRHWRGQRDERDWPAALKRGGEWPWTPVTRPRDLLWARIVDLCHQASGQISERDLAQILGVGPTTVHRAIDEHRAEWDALASQQVDGGGAE